MVSEVDRFTALVPASLPPLATGGRSLVTLPRPSLPMAETRAAEASGRPPAAIWAADDGTTPIPGLDVRNASPRQITNISLDLYAAGFLTYEDYTALAFQPELHPDYDRTVGALTGQPAAPDRPRDFVKYWNERLQFELRHNARDSAIVRQTGRIHELLKGLGQRTRLDA